MLQYHCLSQYFYCVTIIPFRLLVFINKEQVRHFWILDLSNYFLQYQWKSNACNSKSQIYSALAMFQFTFHLLLYK